MPLSDTTAEAEPNTVPNEILGTSGRAATAILTG